MLSSLIIFFSIALLIFPSASLSENIPKIPSINYQSYKWKEFELFTNAAKGSQISGISRIKKYLHYFGYLKVRQQNTNFTDFFDTSLEQALNLYQEKLGLKITGILDSDTINQIMSPRCGVHDTPPIKTLHAKKNYVFFTGRPRWARTIPITLTYAFSPDNKITYLTSEEIRGAFKRAFGHWGSVIPVNFLETFDYGFADIKIGFYKGEHGDAEAFDGVLGVLAHAFSPESGRFHLDAAETWAVDFENEKSDMAVDLESVATHEIGHLLGLAHSSIKESIMYPSLKPRSKKVDLKIDDIKGIQQLYGSNPNFTIEALSESDISSNNDERILINSSVSLAAIVCSLLLLCI